MKIFIILMLFIGLLFASVDINRASVKELITLQGIGKTKAKAIINYRKIKCFKSIEDLVKVKGIGKKTIDKNRVNLSASKCK